MSCSKCKKCSSGNCSSGKCSCSKSSQVSKNGDKWRYTLYTTFVFLLVVNPLTYKLTNQLFSKLFGKIASSNGCPTMGGILLHAIVFTLVLRYMMDFDL